MVFVEQSGEPVKVINSANYDQTHIQLKRVPTAALDPVEFARGHLVASAYLSSTSAREVHVQRLHIAFDRAGIAGKLRFALRVLSLMREAEDLGYGYWFPTPLRAVDGGQLTLLVSASPTCELMRHFPSIRRAGYARVISLSDAENLPRQSLDQWLGDTPGSTEAWANLELECARAAMGTTSPYPHVEFFGVMASGPRESPTFSPHWAHDPARAVIHGDGIVLCRERLSAVAFRYFVGQLDDGLLVAESNRTVDADRLQFGLAALAQRNISVNAKRLSDADVYFMPAQLPRSERRLLFALGQRDMCLPGKAYRVSLGAASSLVNARLKSLGTGVRWNT